MTKNKTIRILNLISFLIMIGINVFAMINLIGYSTKEVSDSIPTLLMPIGITFSIVWTVIYIFLAIYTVYQLFSKYDVTVDEVSVYYLASNLLNVLWIISFHGKMFLMSTIIIILLLADLYLIVRKLRFGYMIPRVTFSIYFGWITVATFVSIFSYISSIDPNAYDSILMRIFTALALIVLMIITFVRSNDYPFIFTIDVAMIGVLLKQVIDFNGRYPEIVIVNIIGIIMTTVVAVMNLTGNDRIMPDKAYQGSNY